MNDDQKEVQVDGETLRLTPIEYNILLLLIKNQGRVFSINQIYENIWNEEAIAADNTIACISGISGKRLRLIPRSQVFKSCLGTWI